MNKQCNRCLKIKYITDFYKCPGMKDGHFNQCISCKALQEKKFKAEHPEIVKERSARAYKKGFFKKREYQIRNREIQNETCRRWRKNNKEQSNKQSEAWKQANPGKRKVQSQVAIALRKGILKVDNCCVCDSFYKIKTKGEAHHTNYKAALHVTWLCAKHHRAWHRVFLPEPV